MKRNSLYFRDSLGNPLVVDASNVFLVQPATKVPVDGNSLSAEPEPGVVVLFLTHAPGRLFVKGDFGAVVHSIFGTPTHG